MSFWGVEVKPGKPFTHYFDRTVGRLRVSQATLGIGSRTARSLVQCNVGSKSPVFLCALLPNKIESCHLDLEFEEADDVVFSVLGPRSVHLSGYYVGKSSSANWNSDTESYGEDIANTDTEVSDQGSEDDGYGGSFIDDDDDGEEVVEEEEEEGEPKVFPSSPISRNGDAAGKYSGNKKGNLKGLKKKKHQAVEPVDDINSQESEDKMNYRVAVLRNKKPASKCNVIESEDDNNEQESKGDKSYLLTAFGNEIPECKETADKVTVDVAAPSQSGGRDEDCRDKDDVPVEVTNPCNSCKDCPARTVDPHLDGRSIKTSDPIESESDHAKDHVVGMTSLENVYADDNTEQVTDPDMSQVLKGTKYAQSSVSNMNVGNRSVSLDHLAEVQVENRQKLKRKKDLEGDGIGEYNGSGSGDAGEELKQVVENDDHCASLDLSACERAENGPKLKKRKKGSREGEWDDCQDSGHVNGVLELKQDVIATDRGNELLPTTEAIQVLTTIQSIGINSYDGSQPDKKNKKKKKKSKVEDDGTGSIAKDGDYSIPDVTDGKVKQMVEATDMDKDLPATTDKNKDPTTQSIDVISNVANESQPEKKREKKMKKKTKVVEDGASSLIDQDKSVDQCKNISNDDVVEQIKQIVEAIEIETSLLPTTKQHESPTTRIYDVSSDVADGFQFVKKHSNKKKAEVGDDGMNSMPEADITTNGILHPSLDDKGKNPESSQLRNFSNGLVIEDLAKGKPDGKVATTGKKVKVHYTGMLRENGHTFTPSGDTFRFCLGDKDVLPGWNIGIEGMRVGDKRRLTIPPLLGYGSEGSGEQIPPNSWLVYDIELVSVRR